MIKSQIREMVPVEEADKIICAATRDYGREFVSFAACGGRVIAEDVFADRDLPPFDRVAMDGIAIRYQAIVQGMTRFRIAGTQAAGAVPLHIHRDDECIEIMTGASLSDSADTVVRYEDIKMENGFAQLQVDEIKKGQNIHIRGSDKKKNDRVVQAGQMISPAIISILASVGKTTVAVKRLPSVIVISTGDELTDIDEIPSAQQIRRSNSYVISAVLAPYGISTSLQHIPDDRLITENKVKEYLEQYDVIILTGGISMGKFDFVEEAMLSSGVRRQFYKVQQKPGKPFWFGNRGDKLVFAFPGNPVSTFLCLYRYFIPWLQSCLGLRARKMYAVLASDIWFKPSLQYFLQVKLLFSETGILEAVPLAGNGSGDFASLADSDAFIELPAAGTQFKKGEVYRVWPHRSLMIE